MRATAGRGRRGAGAAWVGRAIGALAAFWSAACGMTRDDATSHGGPGGASGAGAGGSPAGGAEASAGAGGSPTEGGPCGPLPAQPQTILSGLAGPRGVATDTEFVYVAIAGGAWPANDGTVVRVPKCGGGGPPVVLASGQAMPWAVALDGTFVYFTRARSSGDLFDDSGVYRVAKAGGPAQIVEGGQSGQGGPTPHGPWGVAIHDGWAYYAGGQIAGPSGYVVRVPAPGGKSAKTTWTMGLAAIAAGPTGVYLTARPGGEDAPTGTAVVLRLPPLFAPGATPAVVASFPGDPMEVALDATHVYWATGVGNTIARAPVGGGPAEDLFATQMAVWPVRLALDATHVYFVGAPDASKSLLWRVVKTWTGGAPYPPLEPVAPAAAIQSNGGLAVDDDGVYWSDAAKGTVALVRKPPP